MASKSIDELPLPIISPKLPKSVQTKAQLIFYKHLVRVSAWGLRGMHGLRVDLDGRTERDDEHDSAVWENILFQIQYQVLLKVSGVGSFYRWQAYLQEFVFYNSVGMRQVPFGIGSSHLRNGYSIKEDGDLVGKFVEIKIYAQLSNASWSELRREVAKKLRDYEPKWEWKEKGTNLQLVVQAANLHRIDPTLTYSQIAGQLVTKFPDLATKESGYTPDDVKHLIEVAAKLEF